MMMKTFYLPIENVQETISERLIWLPHLILKTSRNRYLVNVFLLEKIRFAPRKSLLISPFPENVNLGHPEEFKRGTVVSMQKLDFEEVIDDLERAYIKSLEISKSDAYRRAKYWGKLDFVRMFIPVGIYKLFSKNSDEVLAEEFREASYAVTIFRETIFWRNERPTAEGVVYVPLFVIKRDDEVTILDRNHKENRIIMEILRKEENAKKAIIKLIEAH